MKHNLIIANPRPWCIGRMVFDRPKDSRIVSESYRYAGSGVACEADVGEERFQRIIKSRETELRTARRTRTIPYGEMVEKGLDSMHIETSIPFLERVTGPSSTSHMFFYKEDAETPDALLMGEGYIHVGRNLLTLTSLVDSARLEQSILEDTAWYRETTARDDWDIPTKRGFCVKGALIGAAPVSTEVVSQTFMLLPGRPATFTLKMRSALDVDQQSSLLQSLQDLQRRLDEAEVVSKVRILRLGHRSFANMQAEEVLLATEESGVELFRFHLIASGTEDDRARPYTEVQLELGGLPRDGLPPEQATSPVDEAGALQAWDTLLDSFRLRPGAI